MAELTGMRIAVAGAGAFGLAVALRAVTAGAAVELWDPSALGDNASGVAAGMIAPLGEALFDQSIPPQFDLLRAGRDAWRQIERLAPGLSIDRSGAVFLFETESELNDALARMKAMNAEGAPVDRRTLKGGDGEGWARAVRYRLATYEDWRVDPPSALSALRAAFIEAGGVLKAQALGAPDFGAFDAVVLATGMDTRAFAAVAPELSCLSPIKGQLVRFRGGPGEGPVIRTRNLYLVPQPSHVLAGATMESGRSDRTVDDGLVMALRRQALDLAPNLEPLPFEGLAGVRAATPDGLPLAGPSSQPGLFLATGARRNGWLLAPLVGEILVSYLSGGDGGPYAALLNPRRFSRA